MQLINRMEFVDYGLEDLTYRELQGVELVKSKIEKVKNDKMRRMQKENQAGGMI